MQRSDLAVARHIETLCFDAYQLSPRQLRRLANSPTARFWVAEQAHQVVGTAIGLLRRHRHGITGRVYSMAVTPQTRGIGVGRRLLSRLITDMLAAGANRIFLEVEHTNHAARLLYARCGFITRRVLNDYYGPGRMGVQMMYEPRLVRRPTLPHGEGIFTTQPISQNDAVLIFQGPILKQTQTRDDLRCLQIGDDLYMGPSGGLDDYVNHSCAPNAAFLDGSMTLRALRDIAVGEQILWDYSTAMNEPGWGFECACGAPQCRSYVQSFCHLPLSEQQRLLPLSLAYLREIYALKSPTYDAVLTNEPLLRQSHATLPRSSA